VSLVHLQLCSRVGIVQVHPHVTTTSNKAGLETITQPQTQQQRQSKSRTNSRSVVHFVKPQSQQPTFHPLLETDSSLGFVKILLPQHLTTACGASALSKGCDDTTIDGFQHVQHIAALGQPHRPSVCKVHPYELASILKRWIF
jgi:hypothetical protein